MVRRARAAGLVTGAALAVAAIPLARVPATGAAASASVVVRVAPSAELAPAGPPTVLEAPALTAGGDGARGRVRVRNITGRRLDVGARVRADRPDLDGALLVRVEGDGRLLSEGVLGREATGTGVLGLAPGAVAVVDVRARIPVERGTAAGGRAADVSIELHARPAGG